MSESVFMEKSFCVVFVCGKATCLTFLYHVNVLWPRTSFSFHRLLSNIPSSIIHITFVAVTLSHNVFCIVEKKTVLLKKLLDIFHNSYIWFCSTNTHFFPYRVFKGVLKLFVGMRNAFGRNFHSLHISILFYTLLWCFLM